MSEYLGTYNRLFPSKMSTQAVLGVYVLWLLSWHDEMYGKEIVDEITARFKSDWNPSHGLIYPILREMEATGLVNARWEDELSNKKTRRFYVISDKGRNELVNQLENYKPILLQSKQIIEKVLSDLYKD